MCLWIYGAELSLLPLDECSICCTDRQLSKENGMGPPRPLCHKSCHPDQLCREGGIGEKWEGDGRNSHVTASQEDFFFSMYESKVPVLHIQRIRQQLKTFTGLLITQNIVQRRFKLHEADVFLSMGSTQSKSETRAEGKISWSSCRNMSAK